MSAVRYPNELATSRSMRRGLLREHRVVIKRRRAGQEPSDPMHHVAYIGAVGVMTLRSRVPAGGVGDVPRVDGQDGVGAGM